MKPLLFALFLHATVLSLAQQQIFVCTPCGSKCDEKVYNAPGKCSACGMALVEKSALQFDNLTPEQFCGRITQNPDAVLLDVRTAAEFNGSALFRSTYGHFKNAININIDELEDRLRELERYKDREILVYCIHSMRSPRAALLLNQQGFKTVKNMAGGVSTLHPKSNACLSKHFIVH